MGGTFRGIVDADGTVRIEEAAVAAAAIVKQETGRRGQAAAGAGGSGGGDEGEADGGSHGTKRLRVDEGVGSSGDAVKKETREGEEDGEATDDEEAQV